MSDDVGCAAQAGRVGREDAQLVSICFFVQCTDFWSCSSAEGSWLEKDILYDNPRNKDELAISTMFRFYINQRTLIACNLSSDGSS